MKPLSDFYSRLIPMVPGCPEPTANQAIVDAAIAFCEDSSAVRANLDTIVTVVGQSQYLLEAPTADQKVGRVLQVSVGGTPVEVVPSERVGATQSATGTPHAAYTTRDGADHYLTLYPTPDAAVSVSVVAALRPTRTATSLDDDLLDHWVDAVLMGAMSRLLAIPSQPFSDPQGAMVAMTRASVASSKARVEGSYGRTRGQMRVTQRPFA